MSDRSTVTAGEIAKISILFSLYLSQLLHRIILVAFFYTIL